MYKKLKQTLIALFLLLPQPVLAATWQVETVFGTVDSDDLAFKDYLALVLTFVYGFIGLITVMRIVLAGYRYIMANGNVAEAKMAKRMLMHAVQGLALVLCAYLITNFLIQLDQL